MTDPDTPFLHVGMNAPRAGRDYGWIQRRYIDRPLNVIYWGAIDPGAISHPKHVARM